MKITKGQWFGILHYLGYHVYAIRNSKIIPKDLSYTSQKNTKNTIYHVDILESRITIIADLYSFHFFHIEIENVKEKWMDDIVNFHNVKIPYGVVIYTENDKNYKIDMLCNYYNQPVLHISDPKDYPKMVNLNGESMILLHNKEKYIVDKEQIEEYKKNFKAIDEVDNGYSIFGTRSSELKYCPGLIQRISKKNIKHEVYFSST